MTDSTAAVTEDLKNLEVTEPEQTNDNQNEAVEAEVKKNKKKKKKKKNKNKSSEQEGSPAAQAALAAAEQEQRSKEELLKALYGHRAPRPSPEESLSKEHRFWSTQPVPQHGSQAPQEETNGPIEVKEVKDVRAKPLNLPKGFAWCNCDMNDEKIVDEVYYLLYENYVEDDDNMFRFDYSREFLKWALKPPGYHIDLHVGVRNTANNKLMGFITGIPADVAVNHTTAKMVEINFLCVHKQLRAHRLAPVLIKEVTRRTNLKNVWQAVYTAGVVLPKPIAKNRYFHRTLNPKKLIDIGFSRLQPRMTLNMTIKLYRVPAEPSTPGIRELQEKDIVQAHRLLNDYLNNFKLHQVFTVEEFRHVFFPRDNVINTYVVEDPETKQLTDMCSFYTLPSTIIGHPRHNTLKAAYSFYNVANKTSWTNLMADALVFARQKDFDVFNALNVMENQTFFKNLKFGPGDGNLQYYLYNWACPELQPNQVGLVLL